MIEEKRELLEDERLKPHDILIEAHGEDDYYDKVFLLSEMERVYDELGVGKIKFKGGYVKEGRQLVREFMIAFKEMKREKSK